MPDYTNQEILLHQNLVDAGCEQEAIDRYIEIYRQKEFDCLAKQLILHRTSLLNDLHQVQYQIDCLDYLLQQIKAGNKKETEVRTWKR